MLKSLWKYVKQNKMTILTLAGMVLFCVFFPGQALADDEVDCSINNYLSDSERCWFCPLFAVIFNAVSAIAEKTYNALAKAIEGVVLVATAVWIAWMVIKHVSGWEAKNPRQILKDLLNQLFVVLIVILFLRMGSNGVLSLFIEPIFNTGFKLANIAIGASDAPCGEASLVKDGGIPTSMGVNIVCMIRRIQESLRNIMALGRTSMCVGCCVAHGGIPWLLSHWGYIIIGVLLWLAGLLFIVIYPFLLIDCVLQMSIAMALLPAAVGCYAFKITRSYVDKVFQSVMNAMFTFLFLTIIIYIFTVQIDDTVGKDILGEMSDNVADKSFLQRMAWSGIGFLQTVFIILLGWAVLGNAASFAGSFSGGFGIGGISGKVGGMAASAAHKVGAPAAKAAGKMAFGTMKKAYGFAKQGVSTARNNITRNKMLKKGTRDADGNITLKTKNWRRQNITRTMAAGQGSNSTIVKTRKGRLTGREFVTTRDNYIRQTSVKDKNGNIIREGNPKMLTMAGKSLVNYDGKIDQNNLKEVMNNSTMNKNIVAQATLNRLIKEQMPGIKIPNTYKSRNVKVSTNANGNMVIEVEQINRDGTMTKLQTELSDAKGRALTTVTNVNWYGDATIHQTDGICNRVATCKMDKNFNATSKITNKVALTKYYQGFSYALDRGGKFSDNVPTDEMMMDQTHIDIMKKKMWKDGTYYELDGFK